MPTLLQLPQVAVVGESDLVLVEQRGAAVAASAGVLRSGLQQAIVMGGNHLLGRRGPVAGPPEPLGLGAGLALVDGQVVVDGGVVALAASAALTGTPTAPTPPYADSSSAIATTAFVQAHVAPVQSVTVAGDIAGAGLTGGTVTLTLPAITAAGVFTKLGVNAKGQVVSGGRVTAADVAGLAPVASSGTYGDLTGVPAPFSLPDVVAAGTYGKVTVNSKGLVTGTGVLVAGDVAGLAPVATSGRYADLTGLPAGYVLPAASATGLGGVKPGAGLGVAGDGTLGLVAGLPGIDVSAARLTAGLAGASARALSEMRGEVIRVADFLGGKPDGRDATAAMVMALGLAANVPGSTVELCAGAWNFATLAAPLMVPSRTTLRGAGRHQTRITWPDTGSFALFASAGTAAARANDIVLADFTVTGSFATNGPAGPFPFLLYFVDGLRFDNICCEYSRVMGLVARNCTDVLVSGCIVRYCAIDGINMAECNGVTIEGCIVEHCDDDGIAVHSDIYDPGVVRRSVVVSGNRLFDCQGIKVLAPRGTAIIGNTVDCCRAQGISFATVTPNGTVTEGMAAGMASLITGNVVTNIINRANVDNLNQNAPGILITGASARPDGLGAVPGETRSGVVIDPYPYYNANGNTATTATPGSYGVIVANNFIGRTLPACNGTVTTPVTYAKWSDFGLGRMFTRNGWLDPSLAEGDMRDHAVWISDGVVRDVLITGNIIRGMTSGLALFPAQRMDNIVFRGNQVVDCFSYGVVVNTTGTLRAYIEDNLFDLDPFLKHPSRGAGGTWLANGDPTGIKAQAGSGVFVRRNVFRNLCRDSDKSSDASVSTWLFEGNVLEADPVAMGFSTSNKGIGFLRSAAGTLLSQTGSDPGSSAFGQIQTMPVTAAAGMPASGKWLAGHFVRNTAASLSGGLVNLGWVRQTTGSNNVLGTDWTQALAVGAGVNGPLVLSGPASGFGVPGFRQLSFADVAGAAPAPVVTQTYTASGAIAPTDNLSLVNAAAAVAMTLGSGAVDGHPIVIKRYGAGAVTLTASIDGVAGSRVAMNSTAVKESVSLTWSAALATWLLY